MNKHIKHCWDCGVPLLIMEPTDHDYHLCVRCEHQWIQNDALAQTLEEHKCSPS